MTGTAAVCCISHSPLLHQTEPGPGVRRKVVTAFDRAREFVTDFDPDLVVIFGPDHYQGFRYDVMPPFCIGTAAESVGDYDTIACELQVPQATADALIEHVLASDLDVAVSEAMKVDHGIAQPLEVLFGRSDAKPVIPIFINAVAAPLGPARRARMLGQAVGKFAQLLDRKVLFVGSGGLSHDPPVPDVRTAAPEIAAHLISQRRTPDEQLQREQAVIAAGREFASGQTDLRPLNPDFDRGFLDLLASGELDRFEQFDTKSLTEQAGRSVHEVRTWVAAHAALATYGAYESTYSFYEPVPEWIIGFALTIATPRQIG
ncbi:2,3-dihydroxyphenylpropionate 1,2-dioxygenase [Nocardia kruczakiae]|uniref:2,3-dihydroxyphenylpropionate 1,2-dioxygenase n=1 Tax=Nocardia kruczakiae TaxID=261477 RepID=A0ABU1XQT6_9NOCA|nr:3-carboxyethylcatechol 2,3-dioxygenase [Nocardia kruczakiae]MDR7172926.1 2,3-dihydroxyphenylpropionate 1,2-dioxygenase [Nocardia kruczakiae]